MAQGKTALLKQRKSKDNSAICPHFYLLSSFAIWETIQTLNIAYEECVAHSNSEVLKWWTKWITSLQPFRNVHKHGKALRSSFSEIRMHMWSADWENESSWWEEFEWVNNVTVLQSFCSPLFFLFFLPGVFIRLLLWSLVLPCGLFNDAIPP